MPSSTSATPKATPAARTAGRIGRQLRGHRSRATGHTHTAGHSDAQDGHDGQRGQRDGHELHELTVRQREGAAHLPSRQGTVTAL